MTRHEKGSSAIYLSPEVREYQTRVPPRQAINYFEQKALAWKGILATELLGGIKRVILAAITNSEPLRTTQEALEEVFAPYIGNRAALPDQEQLQPYRLETLVRTLTTEAYNQGRKVMVESEEPGFVTGYRYSSILDTRTSPVCRFLHNKILPPEGDVLDRLTPPRHYQCRSILVPVTRINYPAPVYIGADEVERAISLSGRDFSNEQPFRVYKDLAVEGGPLWEVTQEIFHGRI